MHKRVFIPLKTSKSTALKKFHWKIRNPYNFNIFANTQFGQCKMKQNHGYNDSKFYFSTRKGIKINKRLWRECLLSGIFSPSPKLQEANSWNISHPCILSNSLTRDKGALLTFTVACPQPIKKQWRRLFILTANSNIVYTIIQICNCRKK